MERANQAIRNAMQDSTKATRQRGQKRAREILETGQDILANEGYHNLSLRRIAQKMGISKGNLTYYFPNKAVLLRAIISNTIARYEEAKASVVSSPDDDHKSRLRALLNVLIEDARNPKSQRFFYQLWALSTHNKEVAEYREQIYEHFLNQVTALFRAAYPDMDENVLLRKCFLLMSLLEGMNVMCGSGNRLLAKFGDLGSYVEEQIERIIES